MTAPAIPSGGARRRRLMPSGGLATWWWTALCGAVGLMAAVAAATGSLDPAAAAVVMGAAVVSSPGRPRGIQAVAAVGAILGIGVAALVEEPAPLAGVAVAAAAAQLALSARGRPRAVAAGLLVAVVAGALAVRAAAPEAVGGHIQGTAAGVLVLAALAAAYLALPRQGGPPVVPTAAVGCAVLAVSVLGVTEGRGGAAAAALLAAFALAIDRRPAAALVAAAIACAATPALAAGPLALAAAAVAGALASVSGSVGPASDSDERAATAPLPPRRAWSLPPDQPGEEPHPGAPVDGADGHDDHEDEADSLRGDPELTESADDRRSGDHEGPRSEPPADGQDGEPRGVGTLPAWTAAVAALPAAAAALDIAAGRSPTAALALAAVAVAVGLPVMLDRQGGPPARLIAVPVAALPAAALAIVTLVVPARVGWLGDPLDHWPVGIGVAAVGLALVVAAAAVKRQRRPAGPARPAGPGRAPATEADAPTPRAGADAERDDRVDGATLQGASRASDRVEELAPGGRAPEPVEAPRSAMTSRADDSPATGSRRSRRRRR